MDPKLTAGPSDMEADISHVTGDVLSQLRAVGGRITAPRRAVIEALVAAGDEHITADELAGRVHARHPDIHRSTIYRTLDKLQDMGVISHVHLGHGPATFHLGHNRHHHAVCSACGSTLELPSEALAPVAHHLRSEHGWELSYQHFALSARCPDC